jgi:hypothetical protein
MKYLVIQDLMTGKTRFIREEEKPGRPTADPKTPGQQEDEKKAKEADERKKDL